MVQTMTWVGLDVHARSAHAAVVEAETGELRRARMGGGTDEVMRFLGALRGPVRAVYEAGPTGFGLARAASALGVEVIVVAPGKTPRAAADRVKTDQRDAELLVRLLMAGSLRAIHIPSVTQEAARDLVRAREALRQDLMRARHRVSKLLLRYGRVYPRERGTWTVAHRDWLAAQRFDEPALALAYIDSLAAVDALVARRVVLEQHLSQIAATPELWPLVSRLRTFRGIDTLTALALVTEIGDFERFQRPRELSAWLGLVPSIYQSARASLTAGSPRPDHSTRAAYWSRRPGTTCAHQESARHCVTAMTASPRRSSRSPGAPSTASTAPTPACASAASPATSRPSPPRASSAASSGPQPPRSVAAKISARSSRGREAVAGTRD
jgi:transposase